MNLLSSLGQLLLAAGILGIGTAAGLRALPRDRESTSGPVQQLCVGAAVGAGILATAILLVGLTGLLSPWSVWAILALAAVLARREIRRLPELLRRSGRDVLDAGLPSALVLALLLLATAAVAGAPATDWDSLAYHLPVPAGWLEAGAIELPPANNHAAYVGLQHMLYLPALALGADRAPALLSTLFAGLLALTSFLTCRLLAGSRAGSLGLVLVFSSPILLLVAMTPRVDTTLAFYLLLGHYLLLVSWKRRSIAPLLPAAVVLGFSVGVKFLALPYVAALAPLFLWLPWRDREPGESFAPGLAVLGGLAALGLLAAAPWLLKNQILFDSPLYPPLGERVLEPWLRPVFGSVAVPASIPPEVFQLNRWFRVPFNVWNFFLSPRAVSAEIESTLYWPSPLLLFVPLWVLRRRLPVLLLASPPLIFVAFVFGVTSGYLNTRYLIPAILPLTLTGVIVLADLLPAERRLNRFTVGGLALLSLLPTGHALATKAGVYPLGSYYLSGDMGSVAFMQASDVRLETDYASIVRHTNRHLGTDDRVLLLFEARTHYLDAPAIGGSNINTSWPLLARAEPRPPCPGELGATHVVVYRELAEGFAESGVPPDVLRWSSFDTYRQRCLTEILRTRSHTLYGVADAGVE